MLKSVRVALRHVVNIVHKDKKTAIANDLESALREMEESGKSLSVQALAAEIVDGMVHFWRNVLNQLDAKTILQNIIKLAGVRTTPYVHYERMGDTCRNHYMKVATRWRFAIVQSDASRWWTIVCKLGRVSACSCPDPAEKLIHQYRGSLPINDVKGWRSMLAGEFLCDFCCNARENKFNTLGGYAETWVRSAWPREQLGNFEFISVPLEPTSMARQRFVHGMKLLNAKDYTKSEFFWHGNAQEDRLVSMSQNNMDVRFRGSGLRDGTVPPGEYFGNSAEISHQYTNNCGKMLVFLVLRGQHLWQWPSIRHPHFTRDMMVCQNPGTSFVPDSALFILPVGIVVYGENVADRAADLKNKLIQNDS